MASNRIISQMAFLTALLASLLLSFGLTSSCSRKAADDESGTPIPSAEQPRQPGGGFDDPFENKGDNGVPPPGGFGDNTASFAFEMEEQEFAKYVDPNATLTYRFEYINV